MPLPLDGETPEDEAQRRDDSSGHAEPQTHFRYTDAVVLACHNGHNLVAEVTGADKLSREQANKQTNEQSTLDLRTIVGVCFRDQ